MLKLAAAMAGVVGSLLAGACGAPAPQSRSLEEAVQTGPPSARDSSAAEAALEALGYVDWSSTADPALSGVVKHDSARAFPGYNLLASAAGGAMVMDMKGEIVHRWVFSKHCGRCEEFVLLDDGAIVAECLGRGVVKLDRQSHLLWSAHLQAHHDIAVLADGSILVPSMRGAPYQGRNVNFDEIVHLSDEGEELGRWWSFDHLTELRRYHRPLALDGGELDPLLPPKADYYHLNAVEILPDTPLGRRDPRFKVGNVLLCLRNASLLIILDGESWSPVWHWGPGQLDLPHMPTMLESGRLLVFDNGTARGYSRVVELQPDTGRIVWEYGGAGKLWSKFGGSAQRLPGGTTLICESLSGHAFEVTPDGEVVWEFWNPEVKDGKRRGIYRLVRITEQVAQSFLR